MTVRAVLRSVLLPAAALAGSLVGTATTASADILSGPDGGIGAFPVAFVASVAAPDADPPGANDWGCKPSAEHPRPVVLVHGTWENAFANWNALSPALAADGYCVFAGNFGQDIPHFPFKGMDDIDSSAGELGVFVDKVLAATGASQVDLVGHSQGAGPLPRQYLKFHGGADAADPAKNKVHSLIGINPSNHGATLSGAVDVLKALGLLPATGPVLGAAVPEQALGSEFNARLDAGGDTMPGVHYTVLLTRYDEVVTPYPQGYLTAGPGATVDDITLQDVCPADLSDHLSSSYDELVIQLVENALDPAHARAPQCRLALPVVGTLPLVGSLPGLDD